MAEQIILPRQGNTVESCIILEWKKGPGDAVSQGDVLCEVETDKATFEVESTADGVLLERFFEEGADVPVLTPIAAVGQEGESVEGLRPEGQSDGREAEPAGSAAGQEAEAAGSGAAQSPGAAPAADRGDDRASAASDGTGSSPRARRIASEHGIDVSAVSGSGPHGRVIERDVRAALESGASVSPAARAAAAGQPGAIPQSGSGIGGRVTAQDVAGAPGQPGGGEAAASVAGARGGAAAAGEPEYTDTPVKGVRKRVAERMRQSLAESAQLTLHSSADARALLRLRKRVKEQGEALGIGNVTVNDMVMYAAVRALRRHPELNAHFLGDTIRRFNPVHLGFAVDTPRGLLVPVVHNADGLTLSGLAAESARLGSAGREGTIEPDALSGGTFTVTNLGAFGIEYFTPVLNTPQVAILGVNTIQDKPVRGEEGGVELVPHIGFSLTIDHQAVDGAPAARFLKELGQLIEGFDLALAM